jgi:ATP-dependent helicase YprA (DUF1998 family)
MDVFQLRDSIIENYSCYIGRFIQIQDDQIKQNVHRELKNEQSCPDPLIQINPPFAWGDWIKELILKGLLVHECARISCGDKAEHSKGMPMSLYYHPVEAIEAARNVANYVLPKGAGSGKKMLSYIPIVNFVTRHCSRKGIKAIIAYTMNTLPNSQKLKPRNLLCPQRISSVVIRKMRQS